MHPYARSRGREAVVEAVRVRAQARRVEALQVPVLLRRVVDRGLESLLREPEPVRAARVPRVAPDFFGGAFEWSEQEAWRSTYRR